MDTSHFIRLAWQNWATSVTATSQQSGMPSSNLLNNQPFLVWRSTSASNQTLTGNFDYLRPVSYLCLYNHNLSFVVQVRLQLYAEDAQTTLLYDNQWDATSPSYNFGDHFGLYFGGFSSDGFMTRYSIYFFESIPAKSFKVTLSGTTGSYYQAGILRIGLYWQPEASNISFGYTLKREDESRQTALESGGVYTEKKPSWRSMGVKFDYLSESDELNLLDLKYINGKSIPLLVSIYPTAAQTLRRHHTMFALLSEWSELSKNDVCLRSCSFTLREVI
jgi:hypothetical protein